jgi:hypothetical protein
VIIVRGCDRLLGDMRGKDINIDIEAGRGRVMTMKPLTDGESWDFSELTVVGELRDIKTDGVVRELECGVTAEGVVEVSYPAMEAGTYVFAVDASGNAGVTTRLIEGYVTWGKPRSVVNDATDAGVELLIEIDGDKRRALWAWNTEAERQYLKAKAEAEKAAESAEEARRYADEAKKLEEVEDVLGSFDEKIHNAVVPNKVTNTWWIGGIDTGVQVTGDKGEKGDAPYINTDGFWEIGGKNTGVKAQGRDGIDGNAVRRVLIDSVDDLPELPQSEAEAKQYRGIFYVVLAADGYDVYALLETVDGEFAWVNVGDSNAIATAALYGIVKLGTNAILTGAPVGVSASGGLAVREANFNESGTVLKSRDLASRFDTDVPTVEAVRAFLEQYYLEKTHIEANYYDKSEVDIKISDVDANIDGAVDNIVALSQTVANHGVEIDALQADLAEYPTKEYVNAAINSSYDTIENNVKQSLFKVVSAEEFAALTPEPNTLYLIPE